MGGDQQELLPQGEVAETIESGKSKHPKRRMKRTAAIILLVLVCLLAGASVGVALFVVQAMNPMPVIDKPTRVAIAPGTSPQQLARELEQAGLVRSGTVFFYYLRWRNEGARFQAGTYEWKPGVTFSELIAALDDGRTIKEEVNRITIPEGFTLSQIAARLGELHIVDPAALLKTADTARDWDSQWAADIPENPALRHRLEGYLFPETYELKKDATPHDIVQRMLTELDKKLAQLPDGWQDELKARGLSFHELMTVASLIEREATLEADRPLVASVIYNRLQKGMPLQMDATIQYLFDVPKMRLFDKDLQMESPYNTYLHTGLPPGPIASPSMSSIQAALEPAKTRYYYYVTKKDGTSGHYFAETLEQHNANIEQSKKNGGS